MVRDAIIALIALIGSIPAIMQLPDPAMPLASLLGIRRHDHSLLYALSVIPCLAVWATIAIALTRLTGSLPVALFRTALAAFPVTLAWAFVVEGAHLAVQWGAAGAPLAAAMLAHAARLALVAHDEQGRPVITKDDIARAATSHAMAAIGALYVLSTLRPGSGRHSWMWSNRNDAGAELWVWVAIVLIGAAAIATWHLLSRPGFDEGDFEKNPIEVGGAAITLALLALALLGWSMAAIRYAHTIGPEILSGVLHLAIVLLVILLWVDLQTLLERWRSRYGGKIQLDAVGCAILVVSGSLLLWPAMIITPLGWYFDAICLALVGLLALVVGAPLAAYYLPTGESEPLARIVAYALGVPLLACILALWRLPPSMRPYDLDFRLWLLIWIIGVPLFAAVAFVLERNGWFDDAGQERTTRNSRIDDGGPGDKMHRE